MPLYEYENPVTGEKCEAYRRVEDRDVAPEGFRRIRVPSTIYAWRDCPDTRDVDYATALAFKDMERNGVSAREMEMAAGMSTEKIKRTFKKEINRLWIVALLIALRFIAGPVHGADITPGYTFISGETVTHTKLNNAASGTIGVTFYTGATANTAPTNAAVLLLYDPVSAAFRKSTLAQAVFSSGSLIAYQSTNTATSDDWFLFYDTSGGLNYKSTVANLLIPLFSAQTLATNVAGTDQLLFYNGTDYYRAGASNLVTNIAASAVSISGAPAYTTLTNLDQFLVYDSVNGTNKKISAIGVFTNWPTETNVVGTDTIAIARSTNVNEVALSNLLAYIKSNSVVSFTGTNRVFGAGQIHTNAHSLGGMPSSFEWRLVCVTNDIGYLAGEELQSPSLYKGPDVLFSEPGITAWADATNVYVTVNGSAATFYLDSRSAATNLVAVTTNRWRLKPYAVRFP